MSATKIFARPIAGGMQHLVYAMSFNAVGELAMVLPLPVPPGPAEDAVCFISLQGYDDFFKDLGRAFPQMFAPQARAAGLFAAPAPAKLVVHDVGEFEASFVPTLQDFDRLDERFKLSPDVWDKLPGYADWGFAVFKLKPPDNPGLWKRIVHPGAKPRTVHPMAFCFPRRDARSIFFPTVHVHDGQVHELAHFDHTLYCQPDEVVEATFGWEGSDGALGKWVDVERAQGIVDGNRPCYRRILKGGRVNSDVDLTPPAGVELSSLHYVDGLFELRIHATAAYEHPVTTGRDAPWKRSARSSIPALSFHLRQGVGALLADRAADWGVRQYDDTLDEYRVNGTRLASVHLMLHGGGPVEPETGPLRVRFDVSDERVEPQSVALAFDDVPDGARIAEVQAALDAVLASAPLPAAGA